MIRFSKIVVSQNVIEFMITGVAALIFVQIYNSSPVPVAIIAIGMTIAIPLLLKRLDYAVLSLAAILPFRDINLISIIHLKRFVIWSLFIYILIRQFTAPRNLSSHNILLFTKIAALFLVALCVSLFQTISELHSSIYLTFAMLKTTIFSNALVILEQLLILYIIYFAMEKIQHIQRLFDVMLVTSVIIALLGIAQYSLGGSPDMVSFLFDPEIQFYGRASSVFSNPNGLGIFLAPIIVGGFILIVWGNLSIKKKLCFIFPILILDSWAMVISFSRTAIAQILFSVMVIGYIYYIKISHKKLSWQVLLIAIFNVVLIASTIYYYEIFAQLRVIGTGAMQPSYAGLERIKAVSDVARKHAAITAIKTFIQHPLLGIGYEVVAGKRIGSVAWLDNQYLKTLAEMGLLGFIPLIAVFWSILRTGLKLWNKHQEGQVDREVQIIMLLLLTAVSSVIFGYFFAAYLHVITVTGYLWIFSGAIFALEREYNKIDA